MEQQINEWKEKYGEVYALPVEDKTAYLRAPKMVDFKRALSASQKDGELAFGEVMLDALFIGGDSEIKTDDTYFLPARKELTSLFIYEDAEIITKGQKSEIFIDGHRCLVRVITRDDIKTAERKNPSGKPLVTQEKLFEAICLEKDDAFNDRDNASIRFPLYQAIEKLQDTKVAILKKL